MANPSMILTLLGFLAILYLLPAAAADAGSAGAGDSIHKLLRAHGLPAGLVPKAVESFTFDEATGMLEVRLDQPCYAKYDGLAYFDRVVRGNLSYGELRGVVGLSQEELFLWLPVKGIVVSDPSSGVILFDISLAHKQLSLSLFEVPPECRPEGEALRRVGEGLQGRRVGVQEQR